MYSIIIAENLTNDFCNPHPDYSNNRVNIGSVESARLFGEGDRYGTGILPKFLEAVEAAKNNGAAIGVLLVRDVHDPSDESHREEFVRFGEHCLRGSPGAEFVSPIRESITHAEFIDTSSMAVSLENLRHAVYNLSGVDLFASSPCDREELNFLIVGVHTERMIFNTAYLIRNVLGCPNVAICPHLVGTTSREAHYTALRNSFPDALIRIIPDLSDTATFLGMDASACDFVNGSACLIEPAEIAKAFTPEQKLICEILCMHWTSAHLTPLKGGFSGSLLFLAQGWKDITRTEPMVIKIDKHKPIRREWEGYERVKDLFGKNIPTLNPPVTFGEYTGISMDLAALEGRPKTLQELFMNVTCDRELETFQELLDRTLSVFAEKLYMNTVRPKSFAPYRHYSLHVDRQEAWLKGNLDSILKQSIGPTTIDPENVKRMFRLVRKNPDRVEDLMSLSHGDLNLANVICDSRENIWAIDWTHSDVHPLEMDFAKLENDVKFVVSKDFLAEDFPKLQRIEDHILVHDALPPIESLDEDMRFVLWDIRFKRMYQAVRAIRSTYLSLKKEDSRLMYRTALLRYSIHTMSFDQSRNRGECGPVQLWYALYSTEQLLHQLIIDDYFLKIPGERPAEYPARQRVSIDQASWSKPAPSYEPPYYVSPEVLANDRFSKESGWADSEEQIEYEKVDGSGKEQLLDDRGRPLNPRGRTGIAGRGLLGRWGPNPMVHIVVIGSQGGENQYSILLEHESNGSIHIPEGHVLREDTFDNCAQVLLKKSLGVDLIPGKFEVVHNGYIYDSRQTDHAWVVSHCYLVFMAKTIYEKIAQDNTSRTAAWKPLSPDTINSLSASHSELVRSSIERLKSSGIFDEKSAESLLKSTG